MHNPDPLLTASGPEAEDCPDQRQIRDGLYSLRRHHYDKAEAAKHLGIGVSSLYRKLDELQIPAPGDQAPHKEDEKKQA